MRQNSDFLNIDSPQFDCQKFVTHFLKNNSISDLIKKNNDIQNQIKNYDQEIQSLVFENYSKFISSIDTVKKMKNDIFKVDDQMKILEESMGKITNLATKIDDSLRIKREEIQKLEIVNKDLQKLNSLCEFPQILDTDLLEYKKMLDANTINCELIFNKSVESYKVCFQMLKQFKEEPLVAPIYKDSIDKIEEIRTILWNSQNQYKNSALHIFVPIKADNNNNSNINNNNINSYNKQSRDLKFITKKLILMTDDQESVLRNYLKITKDKLINSTRDIVDNPLFQLNSSQQPKVQNIDLQIQQYCNEKKYDVTLEEMDEYKKKLEEQQITLEMEQEGSIIWLVNQISDKLFKELKEEVIFLLRDLETSIGKNFKCVEAVDMAIKEIIMGILSLVSEKMNNMKINNAQVNECFKKIFISIQSTITNNILIKKSLKTEVADRFSENVELVCRGQVMSAFAVLRLQLIQLVSQMKMDCFKLLNSNKQKIEEDVAEAEGVIKKEVFNLVSQFKKQLYCMTIKVMLDLKSFIYSEDQYLKGHTMFIALLHGQILEFCKVIYKIMVLRKGNISMDVLAFINNAVAYKQQNNKISTELQESMLLFKEAPDSTTYFFFSTQFLQLYENKLISTIFKALEDLNKQCLPLILSAEPSLQQYYNSLKSSVEQAEIPKLLNSIKQEILKNYINYSQEQIELMLNLLDGYFLNSNWKCVQDPRDISPAMEKIVQEFKVLIMELGYLFPDNKRGLSKKGSFLKFEASFNIDMERMLVKKLHCIQRGQDINKNVVLMTILKSIFKALVERIRHLHIIDKFGYQQLQIDMQFIIQIAYEMVGVDDENLITGFFFEIIESASDICNEPVKLDQTIVDTITNAKRNKLKI